ncbi:MAG: secretin N-terminal domain-containing protein, partial [Planctomycetota bacterium]
FRMRSRADRAAVIVANRSQRKVMIAASAEQHKEIAEIIKQLDVEGPNDNVVQYVPIENGDVHEAALVISQVFGLTLGSAAAGARGRGRPSRGRPFQQNVVIPDENLNALIIVAPKVLHEKILETVKKIDVPGPGERVVKFYKLKRADVNEVARILSGIFEIQLQEGGGNPWTRRRGRRTAATAQKNAVIIPHPDLSTVVVVAPKITQEEVARVIEQIDSTGPQENQLRYYPLHHADLIETANVLSQIFGLQVGSAQRGWRPRRWWGAADDRRILTDDKIVIPDQNLNSLLVVAPVEVHTEIEKAIARLDVPGPMENELRFYEVDDDFAATTAQTLSQIFNIPVGSATQARRARSRRTGGRVKFGEDPVVIPDAAFGSIIVNAPAEIHEQVRNVLEQLQLLGKRERMAIRFYRLKNTDAEETGNKIGSLFRISVSPVPTRTSSARRTASNRRPTPPRSRRSTSSRRRVEGEDTGATPVGREEGGPGEQEEEPAEGGAGKEYSWGGEPVVVPDKNLNSLIVIAPEYLHTEIERILGDLDVRRPQVLFEVAIIDITADRDLDLGVEFSTIDPFSDNPRGHGFTSFGIGQRETGPDGGFPSTTTVSGGQHGILAGISKGAAGSIPVLVKLLQANSDVNIRSTPLLLINDNEEAEFSSLRSEPTTSISQGTATTRISFSGFVDAGTILRITPHVSEGNYIRLEMYLQVDSWLPAASVEPGIPPPKATNSLNTSITVPNERTVIIGGLSSISRGKITEKVPILGDIPLLGWLFRHEVTEEKTTKLFLFIRPTILSDEKFVDLNKISDTKIREAEKLSEK